MLHLVLMRHAKSSWTDKALGDRDRPQSRRGRTAAPRMGIAMAERKLTPDLILCSPARRTRQTLELSLAAMEMKPKIDFTEALYVFGDGSAYLDVIHKQAKTVPTLMIIGHNPSLAALADRLAGSGDERALATMRRKFPTAAVAHLTFPAARWKDVAWNSGKLAWFLTPKMLEKDL